MLFLFIPPRLSCTPQRYLFSDIKLLYKNICDAPIKITNELIRLFMHSSDNVRTVIDFKSIKVLRLGTRVWNGLYSEGRLYEWHFY